MKEEYRKDIERFKSQKKKWKARFKDFEVENKSILDDEFHEAHEEVFQQVDCLDCANCCKTTSPIFRDIDIQRLSKHLKIKQKEFISKYLHLDDDNDYVLNFSPCPFLDESNHCKVYSVRPLACAEYPHTNRKKMWQILDLTFKNGNICPAVGRILNKLDNNL